MNRRNVGLAAKCLAILFTFFFSTTECKSRARQTFFLSHLVGNTKRGNKTCPSGRGLINGAYRVDRTTQWRNNHLNFSPSGGDPCTHGRCAGRTGVGAAQRVRRWEILPGTHARSTSIPSTTSISRSTNRLTTTSSSPPLWARKIDQKEIKRRKNYQYALKHKYDKNGRRIKDINKERKSVKKKKLFDYEGFKVDKIFACLSEEDMQELRDEELKRKSGEILHNNKYIDTYGVESETDLDDM
ncbi:conserved Plasmodium protein, unknown function [Plasmodium knowlesi strain H]|uniref:Uncharacterized protein n=3 Tax=Plasmodium knowlesi TaxID=5850 RepID=A0A5K1UMY6_PLAKH|nr:conserved Plasmodium protein, unknown function [Plasmodium knowlesi strain H]OTN66137.1 Uncharacterized protein PKNOH_S09528600 [Plasmodium knowlesi]CAA9990021.1 conserved Plasmodium protein, unknown function [Plasmodium knowlesi strain H]SBO24624.1 conserved Plasmodium protein, unknown function [Plasmodium knowlesi strain H]SBO26200.1 conserved Plasmodium protein, unknown function [Plasmodium knowlesi strain H]VVS79495.1 conserved Plasmodium protein, unknown function [Plasmodium knowlesi s|eukprot:XP_002260036.1 hypothetical protein, conserved in Plasmodium species [Plasmodium knowlesi strain H]